MGCIIVERTLGDSNVISFRTGSLHSSTAPVESFKSYAECCKNVRGVEHPASKFWSMLQGMIEPSALLQESGQCESPCEFVSNFVSMVAELHSDLRRHGDPDGDDVTSKQMLLILLLPSPSPSCSRTRPPPPTPPILLQVLLLPPPSRSSFFPSSPQGSAPN
eukprot:953541-Pyramimonas_sp.AAC.1